MYIYLNPSRILKVIDTYQKTVKEGMIGRDPALPQTGKEALATAAT
jgi:hypothetical protein